MFSRWGTDGRKRKGLDGESMGVAIDGFCGISQRMGFKPIIAAVNGYAFGISPRHSPFMCGTLVIVGGGMEMVVNWYVQNPLRGIRSGITSGK